MIIEYAGWGNRALTIQFDEDTVKLQTLATSETGNADKSSMTWRFTDGKVMYRVQIQETRSGNA